MTPLPVCVTGANGFVGSQLCRRLIADGHAVRGLIRSGADRRFIDGIEGLELHHGTLADRDSLDRAFAGTAIVFHTAGHTSDWGPWDTFHAANVLGVRTVVEAAREAGVRRVVHFSSVSVYGFPTGADITEDHSWIVRPGDFYSTSKQQGERAALAFHGHGIEVVVLRPAGVYGPNDHVTSLGLFSAIERRRLPYVDGGRYLMTPVHVANLTQAALLAARHDAAAGQVFNVSDDGRTTWRQYIEWACRYLACTPPAISIPSWLAWPLAVAMDATARSLRLRQAPALTRYRVRAVIGDHHYSSARAKHVLGYAPVVSTETGLQSTVAWYRAFTGGSNTGQIRVK